MKLTIILMLTSLLNIKANASEGITPNHQVNPPHTFTQLVCVEDNNPENGYTIVIDVPNDQDAQAKVFFKRKGEPLALISTWQVKYIVDPGVYAVFANQFQEMDISRGSEDLFELSFQLHSGNDESESTFKSPSLLGYSIRDPDWVNQKEMNCEYK